MTNQHLKSKEVQSKIKPNNFFGKNIQRKKNPEITCHSWTSRRRAWWKQQLRPWPGTTPRTDRIPRRSGSNPAKPHTKQNQRQSKQRKTNKPTHRGGARNARERRRRRRRGKWRSGEGPWGGKGGRSGSEGRKLPTTSATPLAVTLVRAIRYDVRGSNPS